MKNFLLPISIIIAAIIIALGLGHLASEIRIAQMCSDFDNTGGFIAKTMGAFSPEESEKLIEMMKVCLIHHPVLPKEIF